VCVCAYRSTLAKPFAHWAYTLSYNIVSFLLHVTHTCMCMCVHMTERVKCVLWFYMNFLESFMHSARKFVRQEFYHNNKSNNKKLPQILFATCVGRRATELLKSCWAAFQRSNFIFGLQGYNKDTPTRSRTRIRFIGQLTTQTHVLFLACLYFEICMCVCLRYSYIFFNEYYHKITYANIHILKLNRSQLPGVTKMPGNWQLATGKLTMRLGKRFSYLSAYAYEIFRLST